MKLCISKSYGDKVVFKNVVLEIEEGKVTCILGESGAGKTTLLHCLAGLTDYEGTAEYVPGEVGFVFQEPRLLPFLTVEENLAYVGATAEETRVALETLEISAHAKKYPNALSGGEKQRVALARAIAKKPKLLLLDEPFSSLDVPLKIRLLKAFKKLYASYTPTVVFVTHDIDEALCIGHTAYVMKDGAIRYKTSYEPSEYAENVTEKKNIVKALTE